MFARHFRLVKRPKNAMEASPEQTLGCNVSRNISFRHNSRPQAQALTGRRLQVANKPSERISALQSGSWDTTRVLESSLRARHIFELVASFSPRLNRLTER